MDIPRVTPRLSLPGPKTLVLGSLLVLSVITLGLWARSVPSIERVSLWVEPVTQADLSQVSRGSGVLRATRERTIVATSSGRVEALPMAPGSSVKGADVIAVLESPDVELQSLQADQQLKSVEASLGSLRVSLNQQRLAQEAAVVRAHAVAREAHRDRQVSDSLNLRGLVPSNDVATARERAADASRLVELEEQRLSELRRFSRDQIAVLMSQIGQLAAIARAHKDRVRALRILAHDSGTLEAVPVTLGQWVVPGTEIARVTSGGVSRAVVSVQESQGALLKAGQFATVWLGETALPARVSRVDPSTRNGHVEVEITLSAPPPSGTRALASVDADITVATLPNVLSVVRPTAATPNSDGAVFRLTPDGAAAERVTVRFGRVAGTKIEVVSGLRAGDRIITSDIAPLEGVSRVRLR